MHARKTGALIRVGRRWPAPSWAAATGEQIAAVDEARRDRPRVPDRGRRARRRGTSAELGKTAGKDAAAGKPTYPALYGLDASRRWPPNALGAPERLAPRRDVADLGILGIWPGWIVERSA